MRPGISVTKVAQLVSLCGYDISTNKKPLTAITEPQLCCLCRQKSEQVYRITDAFGGGFTGFNMFSHSSFVCKDCIGLTKDFFRKSFGKVILYYNPDTGQIRHYTSRQNSMSDEEKNFWKNFLLAPPRGYFVITAPAKQNAPAHYVIYSKLNYSDGNIKEYLFSCGENIITVNVDDLRQLVELDQKLAGATKKEAKELFQTRKQLSQKGAYLLYIMFKKFFL